MSHDQNQPIENTSAAQLIPQLPRLSEQVQGDNIARIDIPAEAIQNTVYKLATTHRNAIEKSSND